MPNNHAHSIVIMFANGIVGYKTKYQDTIAHSSTEAEFVAACDTAKLVLFFRSILDDLGIPQDQATIIYEDNKGALLMANAQTPTQRTHHLDIKYFSLLDWAERELLVLKSISTMDNAADEFTKPLSKQLFYRHYDTYMGPQIPKALLKVFTKQQKSYLSLSSLHAEKMGGGVIGTYVDIV